jgi:hypothetical protein
MIQTTQQVLHNGARNAVVQVTGVSDGSGNENKAVKVHLADLGAKASASARSPTTSAMAR